MSHRDLGEIVQTVILISVFAGIIGGLFWAAKNDAVAWHDIGVVTGYAKFDQLVWNEPRGAYTHDQWQTANVTTTSHGIVGFDSRGDCPLAIKCGNAMVSSWHLNQTLGIVLKVGGWYEAQDP